MAKDDEHGSAPADPRRRALFKAAGMVGATAAVNAAPLGSRALAATTTTGAAEKAGYAFLHPAEAEFIRAATARLLPGDMQSPGALEADVTNFIDQALASPWGKGHKMYLAGPWKDGTPQQGYQLKFTPAELYRSALTAILREQENANTSFSQMSAADQDAYLQKLETGKLDLDGVPSDVFFDMLLQNTIEGFLSDPIYGGNRAMVGWKAIGFPGAFASWYDLADKHGINLDMRGANPISIADGAVHGHSRMKAR